MSWMDSWSRPSKHQATPAPYYLLPDGESTPYCKSCGRVISSRKAEASKGSDKGAQTTAKYCSSRCRSHKPGKLDREIETAFARFLTAEEDAPPDKSLPKIKGDHRVLVSCDVVQAHVFGHGPGSERGATEKKDKAGEGEPAEDNTSRAGEERTVSHVSEEAFDGDVSVAEILQGAPASRNPDYDPTGRKSVRSGRRTRPSQSVSEVNGSVGGEKGRAEHAQETPESKEKRIQGQKEAKEREMVRSAARRGVVFGFLVQGSSAEGNEERLKCEAVMHGSVVEPSYAKGNWGVRWRE